MTSHPDGNRPGPESGGTTTATRSSSLRAFRTTLWWLPAVQLMLTTLWWAWAFAPPGVVPYVGFWGEVLAPPCVFGVVLLSSGLAMCLRRSPRGPMGWFGLLALGGTFAFQAYFSYVFLTFPTDW